jgi:hypothetical protein
MLIWPALADLYPKANAITDPALREHAVEVVCLWAQRGFAQVQDLDPYHNYSLITKMVGGDPRVIAEMTSGENKELNEHLPKHLLVGLAKQTKQATEEEVTGMPSRGWLW